MSSRIGTLQAPKVGSAVWPAVALALVTVVTLATVAVAIREDTRVPAPAAVTTTVVSGTSANTPSELGSRIVGSKVGLTPTAVNTPSELSGGILHRGTVKSFPELELTAAERYDLHQRI